jgi:hypothetical protein
MPKYRVEFENKQLRSVQLTGNEIGEAGGLAERRTGEILEAIINAKDDKEANEKARRLEQELQTGKTRDKLDNSGPHTHG